MGLATPGVNARVTGSLEMFAAVMDDIKNSKTAMTLLGFVFIFAFLLIAYRHIHAVSPLLPIIAVVGWNGAIMYFMGLEYTPLTAVLGSMTIGVASEYTVLMMERIDEELARGLDIYDAIRTGVQKIGTAITVSGLATVFGFSALDPLSVQHRLEFRYHDGGHGRVLGGRGYPDHTGSHRSHIQRRAFQSGRCNGEGDIFQVRREGGGTSPPSDRKGTEFSSLKRHDRGKAPFDWVTQMIEGAIPWRRSVSPPSRQSGSGGWCDQTFASISRANFFALSRSSPFGCPLFEKRNFPLQWNVPSTVAPFFLTASARFASIFSALSAPPDVAKRATFVSAKFVVSMSLASAFPGFPP